MLVLLAGGHSPTDAARLTGIPRSTVRDWSYGRTPRVGPEHSTCPQCCDDEVLDAAAYAYLLGLYLGDGSISLHRRGVLRLRISLDAAYPGIIQECATAIEAVARGNTANVLKLRHSRCVEVSAYWKHWSCLFPQHGSGPKHLRRIELAVWQRRIVVSDPRPFLRGLVHSDGTRIIATERKGAYVRKAPRYAFRNRSEDILELFCFACREAGVKFTRPSPTQIAVYRKDSVARLDEFVGPKQ